MKKEEEQVRLFAFIGGKKDKRPCLGVLCQFPVDRHKFSISGEKIC